MVEVSDNPAANILIRESGGLDAWREWYRDLGDTITHVDRLEPDLNVAAPEDVRDTTTPLQTVANLMAVLESRRLSKANRSLLLGWLGATKTGPGRIKAALPPGYTLAHKTGTGFDGPTNDIGLVRTPRGAPIYIAAYFTGANPASGADRERVVADAARAALHALGHG
jgi:beta-lactamase class A